MKTLASSLFCFSLLFTAFPAAAKGETAMNMRSAAAYSDGWPKWIGRLMASHNIMTDYNRKPGLAPEYLPLSLIRTGGLGRIIDEVAQTPNVDTAKWPSWIGEVRALQQ